MPCPYCQRDNPQHALVCGTCSRDIAIPDMLVAERLDLIAKRDNALAKLAQIQTKIAEIRTRGKGRAR